MKANQEASMTVFLRRMIIGSLICFTSIVFAAKTQTSPSSEISSSAQILEAKKPANLKFRRFSNHRLIVSKGNAAFKNFYFLFVDNMSSTNSVHGRRSSADGSFTHPYRTLDEAEADSEPNDIIYVFPGDGTTNGMDSGIELQADQKLWGAGTSHVLQASRGNVTIPAQAASAPKITNPAGDGITLSTDNEISGVILSDVFNNGIFGDSPGSVTISSCTISNSQLDGIFIDSAASSTSTALTVSNCVIQASAVRSIDATFSNAVSVQVLNNTVEGNTGGSLFTFVDASTLSVSGNAFRNGTSISDPPLIIIAGSNSLSAVIQSNAISGNICGAMRFILNDAPSLLSLTDNTLTNNGTGSQGSLGSAIFINPNGTSSGNCNLVLSNNTISGNTGSALYCSNGSFNDFQVTASDNSVIGNGGAGFVFANACSNFTLTALNNIISGGNDHGITTAGGLTMTTVTMILSNNQITANGNSANAIALSHDGATLHFTAKNNDLSGNDSSGIILYSSDGIDTVTASIENNTITNNQNLASNASAGIDLEQFTVLCVQFNDNVLTNNVGTDVFIGSTEASPAACLAMIGNDSSSGYTLFNGSGVFDLSPTNAASVNIGTITTIGVIPSIPSCACSP
jgi:hypothetical protein